MFADIGGTSIKLFIEELPEDLEEHVVGYDKNVALLPVKRDVLNAIAGESLIAAAPGRVKKLQEGIFEIFSRKLEIFQGLKLKAKLVVNDCIAFSFFVAKKAISKGYSRVSAVVLGSGANAHSFAVEELFKRKDLWKQPEGGFIPIKTFRGERIAENLVSKQFFDTFGVKPENAPKTVRDKFHENVARWLSMLVLPFLPEAIYFGGGIARIINKETLKDKMKKMLPEIFESVPELIVIRQRDANLRGLKVLMDVWNRF